MENPWGFVGDHLHRHPPLHTIGVYGKALFISFPIASSSPISPTPSLLAPPTIHQLAPFSSTAGVPALREVFDFSFTAFKGLPLLRT